MATSRTGFDADFRWGGKFLDEVKVIVGPYVIRAAPADEDVSRNTDLMVLASDAGRVAVRIRRHRYIVHADEFTIRSDRPSGYKTELAKIIEGWGRYLFYGFANEDETGLAAWLLGDLNVFRLWFNRQLALNGGRAPGVTRRNPDGSSEFRVFRIDELPPEFVVARHTEKDGGQMIPNGADPAGNGPERRT